MLDTVPAFVVQRKHVKAAWISDCDGGRLTTYLLLHNWKSPFSKLLVLSVSDEPQHPAICPAWMVSANCLFGRPSSAVLPKHLRKTHEGILWNLAQSWRIITPEFCGLSLCGLDRVQHAVTKHWWHLSHPPQQGWHFGSAGVILSSQGAVAEERSMLIIQESLSRNRKDLLSLHSIQSY